MSASRAVFLVCALVIVTLATPAAQTVPDLPNSTRITVHADKITIDREQIWARTRGPVVFDIENRDTVPHVVRIPLSDSIPSPKYKDATAGSPVEVRIEEIMVDAGKVAQMTFRVREASHFRFSTSGPSGMTYKYTIYTRPVTGKKINPLDPDIEIRP